MSKQHQRTPFAIHLIALIYGVSAFSLGLKLEEIEFGEVVLGVFLVVLALGLSTLKEWARLTEIAFSFVQLAVALIFSGYWISSIQVPNKLLEAHNASLLVVFVLAVILNLLVIRYFRLSEIRSLFKSTSFSNSPRN